MYHLLETSDNVPKWQGLLERGLEPWRQTQEPVCGAEGGWSDHGSSADWTFLQIFPSHWDPEVPLLNKPLLGPHQTNLQTQPSEQFIPSA